MSWNSPILPLKVLDFLPGYQLAPRLVLSRGYEFKEEAVFYVYRWYTGVKKETLSRIIPRVVVGELG